MSNKLLFNPSLQHPQSLNQLKTKVELEKSRAVSFKDILQQNIQGKSEVKFSKHAQSRLLSREINFTEKDLRQLKLGIQKAEAKGSRDSLIMIRNVAFVVSVKNKTVVTAVDKNSMEERIFTNIDSAVFMG